MEVTERRRRGVEEMELGRLVVGKVRVHSIDQFLFRG